MAAVGLGQGKIQEAALVKSDRAAVSEQSAEGPRRAPPAKIGAARLTTGALLAFQFLTTLPVRAPHPSSGAEDVDAPQPPDMGAALPWFPVVGACLGGALAGVDWALSGLVGKDLRSVLVVVLSALLTGMLHLDGFLDTCDGLLGVRTVARRLEIMRDSRVGAYGVVGGALLLLAKYAALNALPADLRALGIALAPIAGRWSMVYAMSRYPYLRTIGAGSLFRASGQRLFAASLVTFAMLAGVSLLLASPVQLVWSVALVGEVALLIVLVTLLWTGWASRRLGGGLTGDIYGATNEIVEFATLAFLPQLVIGVTHLGSSVTLAW